MFVKWYVHSRFHFPFSHFSVKYAGPSNKYNRQCQEWNMFLLPNWMVFIVVYFDIVDFVASFRDVFNPDVVDHASIFSEAMIRIVLEEKVLLDT